MKGYDNARSEKNDAERFVIYELRKKYLHDGEVRLGIAQRITANIETVVADRDAYLEQYFVY